MSSNHEWFIVKQQELDKIISVFRRYSEINQVILFGSRAKGTAKVNSDIDLAVEGLGSNLQIEMLAMELDELSLPYKFDVKSVAGVSNPALKEHIARVGICIYP